MQNMEKKKVFSCSAIYCSSLLSSCFRESRHFVQGAFVVAGILWGRLQFQGGAISTHGGTGRLKMSTENTDWNTKYKDCYQ